jgi:dihydroorotase
MNTMKNYLIHNALVVNQGKVFQADVLIENGLIAKIMGVNAKVEDLSPADDTLFVDANGKYLLPGVIDTHVHFRQPGLTEKADMYSESRAATAGGVTSVIDMPNVNPPTTTLDRLQERFEIAKDKMFTNYSFYLAATDDNIEQIRKLDKRSTGGIKLFMGASTGNMTVGKQDALEKLFQQKDIIIAAHCEDNAIIAQNTARYKKQYGEEHVPMSMHDQIRSREACLTSTRQAVLLAQQYGTQLHVLHVSTADELALFSDRHPNITAEVCVAYLFFDHNDYTKLGTSIKCNPSIKSPSDKAALLDAVVSGKVSTLASDHAPHTWQEKQNTYFQAPSGIPMTAHILPLMLELYADKKIKIQTLVERMCHAPAKRFKIHKRGFIEEGYHADLVLIDPDSPVRVGSENIYYKCSWSPLTGMRLRMSVETTWINGEIVYHKGQFAEQPHGMPLVFNPHPNVR